MVTRLETMAVLPSLGKRWMAWGFGQQNPLRHLCFLAETGCRTARWQLCIFSLLCISCLAYSINVTTAIEAWRNGQS